MTKKAKGLLLLVVLLTAAACYKTVSRPITPPETVTLMTDNRSEVVGLVLRDGTVRKLPSRATTRVEGDSLILVRWQASGRAVTDSVRVAEVEYVQVQKIQKGKTIAAIMLVPLTVAVVALIVAASEDEPEPEPVQSCPFVYAYDGEQYVPVAEPLGGAISPGLQRSDLSRLEGLVALDGEYRVIIANEQTEVEHLDAFSLVAVDHPPGTEVVAGRTGELHVVGPLVPPATVTAAGEDLLPALRAQDGDWWPATASTALFPSERQRDTLTVVFPRPASTSVRLVVHARTSLLGSHTLKTMLDLWGGEVDYWYGMLDGSAPVRTAHEDWLKREELFVTQVWVHEQDGWAVQQVIMGGGPIISELQAVPLDLSRAVGPQVELRLHPARGFWDIDLIALDTSTAAPPRITALPILEAEPLEGQDSRERLLAADGSYLVMPRRGQRIDVTFAAPPPVPGMTRTLFSRTTGFYRIETDRSGVRQAAQLDSLWLQPGHAVRLAERKYLQTQSAHRSR